MTDYSSAVRVIPLSIIPVQLLINIELHWDVKTQESI